MPLTAEPETETAEDPNAKISLSQRRLITDSMKEYGVDTESSSNDVRQWVAASASTFLFWLDYTLAQFTQEFGKSFLFVCLCLVVGRPFLSAGHFDRLANGYATIQPSLFLNRKHYCMVMFTWLLASLKIRASAKRMVVVKVDDVASISRLRGYFPTNRSLNYLACLCYLESSFFSCIHLRSPSLNSIYAYNSTHSMHLSIGLEKIFLWFAIDNGTHCVIDLIPMNEVQGRIAQLEEKGWTLAAIADSGELKVHRNTVGMWKAGTRYPRPDTPVLDALDRLLKRNRIPKKKRYAEGSRRQGGTKR